MIVVDEFYKSFSTDDGDEHDEQVGDHLFANEEAIKIPTETDRHGERFGNDG
jgi:hypothetical protein